MDKPESVETGSIVYFLYGNAYQLGVAGEAGVYWGPECIRNAMDHQALQPHIPWTAIVRYVVIASHDQAMQGYFEAEYGGLLQ